MTPFWFMNLSDIFTSKVLFSRNIKARSKLFLKKKKNERRGLHKKYLFGGAGCYRHIINNKRLEIKSVWCIPKPDVFYSDFHSWVLPPGFQAAIKHTVVAFFLRCMVHAEICD